MSRLKGGWVGNLGGTHTGTIRFNVGKAGKRVSSGIVRGTGTAYSVHFKGQIRGRQVHLNGRRPRATASMILNGSVDPKRRRMSGTWSGTINGKVGRGNWSANYHD